MNQDKRMPLFNSKKSRNRALIMLIILGISTFGLSQSCKTPCPNEINMSGTYNATAGSDYYCITANGINVSFNNLGAGDTICVAPGITYTMPSDLNYNGLVTFIISAGATAELPGSGSNGNVKINNYGTLKFTQMGGTVNFIANGGSVMKIDNYAGATVNALMVCSVVFGNGSDFFNEGAMNFNNLELAEAASPYNAVGGNINVKRAFYIHSIGFEDYGFVNITCEPTGLANCDTAYLNVAANGCGLTVGDKGPANVLFGPNTCTIVNGQSSFGGPVNILGYYEVVGDFIVTKFLNGSMGTDTGVVVVKNGISSTSGDGTMQGGLKFYDVNTASGFGNTNMIMVPHGLDMNNGNPTDNFVVPGTQPVNPWLTGPNCMISAAGLSGIMCNNSGTNNNPSDDFISFSLNPIGNNNGTQYTVSVSSGSISPNTGSYGVSTAFMLNAGSAGGGPVTVTITDGDDNTCTLAVIVTDPGTCSNSNSGTFDLSLTKSVSSAPAPVTIGSNVTYVLTVINQGDIDATNVQLTDFIPVGLTLNDADWTAMGNVASLNVPIASIPAMSQTTVDITFAINAQASGSITNTAEIASALGGIDGDSSPGNGNAGSGEDDFGTFDIEICVFPDLIVQNETICKGSSIDLSTLVISHSGNDLEYYTTLADAQTGTNALISSTVTINAATNYYIKSLSNPDQEGCNTIVEVTVFVKATNCAGITVTGP